MLALWAAPARATDYTIPGTPLNIYANDDGQLQVAFAGSATGEFYPGALAPASAGVNVASAHVDPPALTVYGFRGHAARLPGHEPAQSGPHRRRERRQPVHAHDQPRQTAGVPPRPRGAHLRQRDHGRRRQFTLEAVSTTHRDGPPLRGRGPLRRGRRRRRRLPRSRTSAPGRRHQPGGRKLGTPRPGQRRRGTTTRSRFYDERLLGDRGSTDTRRPTSPTRSIRRSVDNGVGVQWDFANLGTGTPAQTYSTSPGASSASPRSTLALAASTRTTGQTATVTVTARNSDGNPDPGRAVRYSIDGANPGAGAVTTGADGTAAITWTGTSRHRHAHRLHRSQRQRRRATTTSRSRRPP